MTTGKNDRRTEKRYTVDLIFTYELIDREAVDEVKLHHMGTALIKDITINGARISSSQSFPAGVLIVIRLLPYLKGDPVEITGRIVWTKEISEDVCDCGVRFQQYTENAEQELERYMTSLKRATEDDIAKTEIPEGDLESF